MNATSITAFISGDLTTGFIAVAGAVMVFYGIVLAYKTVKKFLR